MTPPSTESRFEARKKDKSQFETMANVKSGDVDTLFDSKLAGAVASFAVGAPGPQTLARTARIFAEASKAVAEELTYASTKIVSRLIKKRELVEISRTSTKRLRRLTKNGYVD